VGNKSAKYTTIYVKNQCVSILRYVFPKDRKMLVSLFMEEDWIFYGCKF